MICGICGNADANRTYEAREMMFGTRQAYPYFQCASCGCLQIAEFPSDLSRHYPSGYPSFKPAIDRRFVNPVRNVFRIARYRYAVLNEGFFGRILCAIAPKEGLRFLSLVPLKSDSRVLDVGSGTGELLFLLRRIGMTELLGVDAFVEHTLDYPNGLKVLKGTIHDVTGEWDCVILSHSLEHMPDQVGTMQAAAGLLAPGGCCLVRIPIVSWAWEHYGVNWAGLDAPRHFFLHSLKSFGLLVARAGLRVERTTHESTHLQFRGSELYARGIPLLSDRSEARSVFTRAQLREFRRQAEELNRQHRGDQATFYLHRK